MTREIKAYNQGTDARWYAGEVQPSLVGIGASRPEDFVATDTSNGVCFGLSIWWNWVADHSVRFFYELSQECSVKIYPAITFRSCSNVLVLISSNRFDAFSADPDTFSLIG